MTGFHPGERLDERFAAVPPRATLSIDEINVADDPEPYVRLLVDGLPFVALPRSAFLDAFHRALQDLEGPVQ